MKSERGHSLPPSAPPDLIGGHFRSFRKDPTGFLTRQAALGDVSYFRLGPQGVYAIAHPGLVRDVLVLNAHKFVKGRALQRAKALLGEGLLTSEGEHHLRQRRMIQPAFHRTRIEGYGRSMIELGEAASASWENGEVRDISHEMMQLTLRIVARTLFSANVDDEADEVGNAMTTVTELFNFLLLPFSELLQKLPIPHTLRFNRARRVFNSVIYRMIDDRRVSGEDPGDLLAMLLAARDEDDATAMTDEQVRDEALTLFLAGHETTANALTWTWYLLAGNPAKREKLFAELDDVLGGREPSYDDLPNLKYTESVLAESMRLFPPAWTLGRLSIEDHELGGYFVPTGSLILASQFVIHRDGRFWDAPDAFLPERWETVSVKEAGQQYTCFPFGAGVRRCIGESFAWAEGILLLAVIARRWTFELEPDQPFGLHPMITLRPKYPMLMRIIRR